MVFLSLVGDRAVRCAADSTEMAARWPIGTICRWYEDREAPVALQCRVTGLQIFGSLRMSAHSSLPAPPPGKTAPKVAPGTTRTRRAGLARPNRTDVHH